IGTAGSFATRRTAAAENLNLEVQGVGRIRFPVTPATARALCEVARPARHGFKDQTRLDRRVRDTWEIAKSRISIDELRWKRTLTAQLDRIRRDLGLPDGCCLKAQLYNMLVYAPGQFFVPHQDSEKTADMIGTLVVSLPSRFAGGSMAIEHHGQKKLVSGSGENLTFIAFYADCHHEVRLIRQGYRVVLTYNLIVEGEATAAGTPADRIEALTRGIRDFFETQSPPRWSGDRSQGGMSANDEFKVMAFSSAKVWEQWLAECHADTGGIWLRFYKKESTTMSVSYDEALAVALCYGWIDGQLKKYDGLSWLRKFTPRRAKSIWSKRNCDLTAHTVKAEHAPMGSQPVAAFHVLGRPGKQQLAKAQRRDEHVGLADLSRLHLDPLERIAGVIDFDPLPRRERARRDRGFPVLRVLAVELLPEVHIRDEVLGALLPQELQRMTQTQLMDDRGPVQLPHPQRFRQRLQRIGRAALPVAHLAHGAP
ncbi:MAG: hypothetical protein ACRETG_11045, partial [Steroidobacteraceae bacterium]